jgi:tRNA A-37 threonylcarbamoyl transferase component Bud32
MNGIVNGITESVRGIKSLNTEWSTNRTSIVEIDGRKVFKKEFSSINTLPIRIGYAYAAFNYPSFYLPNYSVRDRIENEYKKNDTLKQLGINTPIIYNRDDRAIYMELIDGQNLFEFYQTAELDEVRKITEDLAKTMKMLHDLNYSFVDLKAENVMVMTNPRNGSRLCFVDGEFFTGHADRFQKDLDISTFLWSVSRLKPDKYKTIFEIFSRIYEIDQYDKNKILEYVTNLSLVAGIFSPKELTYAKNRTKNILELTRQSLS